MINVEYFNQVLRDKNLSIVCTESITAGLLSSIIASVSGASDVLKGSIVTYSSELKTGVLKVDPKIIDNYTAESMETTIEMIYGLIKLIPSASIHIAVTGVASKSDKVNKPLGQVYVAIHYKNKIHTKDQIVNFDESETDSNTIRNEIRENTVDLILNEILEFINRVDNEQQEF
jgi:nicotinamide-nucleotide amidase